MSESWAARERLVLAAGLGSAGALVAAALLALRTDSAAGEVIAARLAGVIADSVRAEWERLLESREDPAQPLGLRFHWALPVEQPSTEPTSIEVLASEDPAQPSPLGIFLRTAARLEIDGKPDEAVALLREGLQRNADSPLRAEVYLRAIQVARRSASVTEVRTLWSAASEELAPRLARDDSAYVLLCALAAAPDLMEEVRLLAQRTLVEQWTSGALALPTDGIHLATDSSGARVVIEDPARLALKQRLADLAENPAARVALDEEGDRRALLALEQAIGAFPQVSDDGSWTMTASASGLFCARAQSSELAQGFFLDPAGVAERLVSRLSLPADFALDFSGTHEHAGEIVRGLTPLAGNELGFFVRHADPAQLAQEERRRSFLMRGALLLLAGLLALATLFTVRALARERRLAALKQAFIANVSHDLRTPLASILLMAENLEAGHVDPERARGQYFGALRREAQRLRRLVDDVLDFSRLERGESTRLTLETVELEAFAQGLASETAERVAAAGGQWTCETHGLRGTGELDDFALRRALWNLVDNALEHSGSLALSLCVAVEDSSLVVRLCDRGQGIPADEREQIFEPYARGSTANQSKGGTGLGLAIVREIARAHGGEARARPGAGGVGATFEIVIPLGGAHSTPS